MHTILQNMTIWLYSLLFTPVFKHCVHFSELAEAVESCYFYHEDYNMYMSKYCDNGCCSDYGDDDEICCIDG